MRFYLSDLVVTVLFVGILIALLMAAWNEGGDVLLPHVSVGAGIVLPLAVSLGGDSDTIACIAGGIAQVYYGGLPDAIRQTTLAHLDDQLRGLVEEFESRFMGTS